MSLDFLTIQERLDELDELPAGHARGAALERLMDQMFTSVPGVSITGRNVMTGHRDEELDLLLAQHRSHQRPPLSLGTDIILQCKSSAYPLNSMAIDAMIAIDDIDPADVYDDFDPADLYGDYDTETSA